MPWFEVSGCVEQAVFVCCSFTHHQTLMVYRRKRLPEDLTAWVVYRDGFLHRVMDGVTEIMVVWLAVSLNSMSLSARSVRAEVASCIWLTTRCCRGRWC